MLKLFAYLLGKGVVTTKDIPDLLGEDVIGLPAVSQTSCASGCRACMEECPTKAISQAGGTIVLDRGACIGCNYCVSACPSGTLQNDRSTSVFSLSREQLRITAGNRSMHQEGAAAQAPMFGSSLAVRVVSTGCSACDLELSAASNPVFDLDRFGISVVASPRYADALVVTGPVPKAMHEALLSCYKAMAEPRLVIACGTCAVSGGLHAHGYAEANGVSAVLPVDVFIPGCPPHPLQILRGLLAAKKLAGRTEVKREPAAVVAPVPAAEPEPVKAARQPL